MIAATSNMIQGNTAVALESVTGIGATSLVSTASAHMVVVVGMSEGALSLSLSLSHSLVFLEEGGCESTYSGTAGRS